MTARCGRQTRGQTKLPFYLCCWAADADVVSVSSGSGDRRLNINALVVEGRRLNASSGTQTRGSGEGKVGGGGDDTGGKVGPFKHDCGQISPQESDWKRS